MKSKARNILYLFPGPVPQSGIPEHNELYYLSNNGIEGDCVSRIWFKNHKDAHDTIESSQKAMGNFRYRVIFETCLPFPLKFIRDLLMYIYWGIRIYYFENRRYESIVCWGVFTTGLAGSLLKLITRAKLNVIVVVNMKKSFCYKSNNINTIDKFKDKMGTVITSYVINRCDAINMVAPNLLDGINIRKSIPIFIFPNFVPITSISSNKPRQNYILLLGYPWHRKGVDILIKAFNKVYSEYPLYKLKIVGHCDNINHYKQIAGDNDNIELCKPVSYSEALELISNCGVFILASRAEGSARVLIEAMAAKRPLISSNIDGASYLICNNSTGVLFESENVEHLATSIRKVLDDAVFAHTIAENGYNHAYNNYSERCYVDNFNKMINSGHNKTLLQDIS